MKRMNVVAATMFTAVLVMTGCGDSDSTSTASTSSTSSSSASSASSSSAAASSTSSAAPASGTLAVATNSEVGQQIIVDGSGRTVYLYEPDGTSATTQVPSGIKSTWPAVTASGTPSVSADLDASKVAAQPQPDGTTQISYNGHLLYTFVGDSAPGDASGQGLGGIWFTLSPAGDKIP